MLHVIAGLVCAAIGMATLWFATRFRTAQASLIRRGLPIMLSAAGVVAVLVGFVVAFAA